MEYSKINVSLRFKELIDNLGLNVSSFAKALHYSRPDKLYNILNGIYYPSFEILSDITKYFENINIDYLVTGRGKMFYEEMPVINYDQIGARYYDVDFVAGFDLIFNDQTINPTYYIDFKPYNHADFWVNVTGRSMEPMLSPGDIIAIKEIKSWREFLLAGEVYAIVATEMRTIKIIADGPTKDSFLLIPINQAPEYCRQVIQKSLIHRVFSVLGCMKKVN